MLSQQQNDLVTRAAKGTPGGDLLRRYWQPVALEEELPPGAPPKPVRVMGEISCCSAMRRAGPACLASIVRTARRI